MSLLALKFVLGWAAALSLILGGLASPAGQRPKRQKCPLWPNISQDPHRLLVQGKFAIKENHAEHGPRWLDRVSDPSSPQYGQHWTAQQIIDVFRPRKEHVDDVSIWLRQCQIFDYVLSPDHTWLTFNASLDQLQALLQTKCHQLYDADKINYAVGCDEVNLPARVHRRIDYILPTSLLALDPLRLAKRDSPPLDQADVTLLKHFANYSAAHNLGRDPPFKPKVGENLGPNPKVLAQPNNLASCDKYTTPACLKALYSVPDGSHARVQNALGIVEFTPQAYKESDMDMFFHRFKPEMHSARPVLKAISGGSVQTDDVGFDFNGESNLDLQYSMHFVHPQQVNLYQTGDKNLEASFNTFLEGIDASYCAGSDPRADPQYPRRVRSCGKYPPPKVLSVSYGYNEVQLPPAYFDRQCREYMKLGLMGITVIFSSGDSGVAGNMGACIDFDSGVYTPGDNGTFNPSFPPTCPYVTAIGATEIKPGQDVRNRKRGNNPERACQELIYSGGGFSNMFNLPDYQRAAVSRWWQKHDPKYPQGRYNDSRASRGYPDFSANGARFPTAVAGTYLAVYGTSASAPFVASLIVLINEARAAKGKKPVGFINHVLYRHPEMFYDVVEGNSPGCGTDGFAAVEGWDPTTGLGTPNFPKMLEVFMRLP